MTFCPGGARVCALACVSVCAPAMVVLGCAGCSADFASDDLVVGPSTPVVLPLRLGPVANESGAVKPGKKPGDMGKERDDPGRQAIGGSYNPGEDPCAGQVDGWVCDDGNPCTLDDECAAGTCAGELNPQEACDDCERCTVEYCMGRTESPTGTPACGY